MVGVVRCAALVAVLASLGFTCATVLRLVYRVRVSASSWTRPHGCGHLRRVNLVALARTIPDAVVKHPLTWPFFAAIGVSWLLERANIVPSWLAAAAIILGGGFAVMLSPVVESLIELNRRLALGQLGLMLAVSAAFCRGGGMGVQVARARGWLLRGRRADQCRAPGHHGSHGRSTDRVAPNPTGALRVDLDWTDCRCVGPRRVDRRRNRPRRRGSRAVCGLDRGRHARAARIAHRRLRQAESSGVDNRLNRRAPVGISKSRARSAASLEP